MDDEASFENKILEHLEELIVRVIIGTLHYEMMVMSSSQYIIYPHEPNGFLDEDSLFEHDQHDSGLYDSDEVHSLPMISSQDAFYFQFDYWDPIGIW